jgi:hypothetical protein
MTAVVSSAWRPLIESTCLGDVIGGIAVLLEDLLHARERRVDFALLPLESRRLTRSAATAARRFVEVDPSLLERVADLRASEHLAGVLLEEAIDAGEFALAASRHSWTAPPSTARPCPSRMARRRWRARDASKTC